MLGGIVAVMVCFPVSKMTGWSLSESALTVLAVVQKLR